MKGMNKTTAVSITPAEGASEASPRTPEPEQCLPAGRPHCSSPLGLVPHVLAREPGAAQKSERKRHRLHNLILPRKHGTQMMGGDKVHIQNSTASYTAVTGNWERTLPKKERNIGCEWHFSSLGKGQTTQ